MDEFVDLQPWQAARALMREIYRYTTQGAFNKDPWLREQVRSTCAAIMHNIAQSLGCSSDTEVKPLLGLAQRACCALRSHLYIALDQHYLSEQEFRFLSDAAGSIHQTLHRQIRTGGRSRPNPVVRKPRRPRQHTHRSESPPHSNTGSPGAVQSE